MIAIKYACRTNAMTKVYVYIDSRIGHDLCGRIFAYNGNVEIAFTGILNMIKKMENVLNGIFLPQSTFECRSFNKRANTKVSEETSCLDKYQVDNNKEHEYKATFVIQIKYRQNATWQGEIR